MRREARFQLLAITVDNHCAIDSLRGRGEAQGPLVVAPPISSTAFGIQTRTSGAWPRTAETAAAPAGAASTA